MTRRLLASLGALVALGASSALGQRATWDIGTSSAPSFETRSAFGFSLSRANGYVEGAWRSWGVGNAEVRWFRRGAFFLGAGVEGARDTTDGYGAANLVAGAGDDRARAWVRLGMGQLRDADGQRSLRLGGFGGSARRGRVLLEMSITRASQPSTSTEGVTVDTLGVPLPPTRYERVVPGRIWHELRGRLVWAGGPLGLQLAGGLTSGDAKNQWLQGTATRWLSRSVALVGVIGNPPLPVVGIRPPAGQVTLGLRFALGRQSAPRAATHVPSDGRAFVVLPSADRERRVRVRVPRAHTVELTADFVDWQVVSLRAVGNGLWEASLPISAGNHRVSLRIDGGAWQAPPGLPRVEDDFGGAAGLLHVE